MNHLLVTFYSLNNFKVLVNFLDFVPQKTKAACGYCQLYVCVFQGREGEPRSDPGHCSENTGEEERENRL